MQRKHVAMLLVFMLLITFLSACKPQEPAAPTTTDKQTTPTPTPAETPAASDEEPKEEAYLAKYDPPITIDVPFIDANRMYPQGQDYKNNVWTQSYEEDLGIKFNYVWEVKSQDYTTKLNMAIASDELPQIFPCDYNIYCRLAAAGQLADLTDHINSVLNPVMLKNIEEDPFWKQVHTINGKIYGMGQIVSPTREMLHYRDDWAAAVGITKKPETLADVIDMARKFKEGDPTGKGTSTVGIGVNKNLFGSPGQVNFFFNAFDAWPDIWIEKNGELVYGGLDENNKKGLEVLQQMYKEGLIDGEFGLKDPWNEVANDISSDRIGMIITPSYFSDWEAIRNVSTNYPWQATWTSVLFPHEKGGPVKGKTEVRGGNVMVVRKDFEHPEALVKMLNLTYKNRIDPETEQGKFHSVFEEGNVVRTFFLNFVNDIQLWPDTNLWNAERVTAAVDGKISPDELTDEQLNYYNDAMKFVNKEDFIGWNYYNIFYIKPGSIKDLEFKIINEQIYTPNQYYGPNTDTMNKNWGNIKTKQTELFTRMIMGEPIDAVFQEWVDYFNSQGGDIITKEVNDWYKSK